MSLSTLLHSSGTALFGYALYYDLFQVHLPRHLLRSGGTLTTSLIAFPGKWKYLTVWNLVLQFAYHTLSLTNDLVGTKNELNPKKQSWLQKLRDIIFASWAFPTGLFVSTTFWTLYTIDRSLVFPKIFDEFFPSWLNHAVHTGPILFVTFGALAIPRRKPVNNPNKALTMGLNVGLSVAYSSWITFVSYYSGVWAYPILEVLNPIQKTGFILSSGVIIFGFYLAGEQINDWRWGNIQQQEEERKVLIIDENINERILNEEELAKEEQSLVDGSGDGKKKQQQLTVKKKLN